MPHSNFPPTLFAGANLGKFLQFDVSYGLLDVREFQFIRNNKREISLHRRKSGKLAKLFGPERRSKQGIQVDLGDPCVMTQLIGAFRLSIDHSEHYKPCLFDLGLSTRAWCKII